MDLQKETYRLEKYFKINRYIGLYDTGVCEGMVAFCIAEKEKSQYDDFERKISAAGYVYAGNYPRKINYLMYTISEEKLKNLLESIEAVPRKWFKPKAEEPRKRPV